MNNKHHCLAYKVSGKYQVPFAVRHWWCIAVLTADHSPVQVARNKTQGEKKISGHASSTQN